MERERLVYLDQMKGVAIFFMVMGHVMLFAFKMGGSMIEGFGVSNMPIFFYVSGFLAYCETGNHTQFLQKVTKRSRRLLIPWFSVTIAMCLYAHRAFEPTLLSFYWFFYMLFLITIVFYVFEHFIAKHFQRPWLYVSAYFLLMALFCAGYYSGLQSYRFPFAEFVVFSTSYLLGWCSRKYRALHTFCLSNTWLYVACIPLFIYGCCNLQHLNVLTRVLAGNAGVLLWLSFFYHLGEQVDGRGQEALSRLVAYVGQCSLSIYMLNNFFIPDLTFFNTDCLVVGNGFLWQFLVVALLTVPIVAACVWVRAMSKHNKILKHIFC